MNTAKYSFALAVSGALCLAALPRSFSPKSASFKDATPLAATASTAVPALVPFSGVVVAEDKPLSEEASITFLIYKDEAGGEPLFTESQTLALDATGHYKTQLGETLPNGIPLDLFTTGEARWLEVQVAGQAPQPRVLLVSVPYALKAGDASTLGGLPASAYALAGTKTGTSLAGAALTPAISPDVASNVTTTGGTSGYLPVFTGPSTVVDSILFQSATGIGVGDVPNSTAIFDVNGKSIWRGLLNISRAGDATTTTGFDSYPILLQGSVYNSATKAAVLPVFQLQVEPTGNDTATPGATFNLLANSTGGTPAETGLFFNTNGTIHFATGQTFPGTGPGTITGVTAGTALTGGGTSGNVTLSLDTTKVPLLAANNAFIGTISAIGGIFTGGQLTSTVPTGISPLSVTSTTVVPNLNASLLGGFAPSAFASVATANNFTSTQTFSKAELERPLRGRCWSYLPLPKAHLALFSHSPTQPEPAGQRARWTSIP